MPFAHVCHLMDIPIFFGDTRSVPTSPIFFVCYMWYIMWYSGMIHEPFCMLPDSRGLANPLAQTTIVSQYTYILIKTRNIIIYSDSYCKLPPILPSCVFSYRRWDIPQLEHKNWINLKSRILARLSLQTWTAEELTFVVRKVGLLLSCWRITAPNQPTHASTYHVFEIASLNIDIGFSVPLLLSLEAYFLK